MNTGYELTTEQTQKPQMTQELIQAIQILQFNNQELAKYVENELLENPILEAVKDKTEEESVNLDELRERLMEINSENSSLDYAEDWDNNREEFSFERYVAVKHSLIEHLITQLKMLGLSEEEVAIGEYIIHSIDENGYFSTPIAEVAKALDEDAKSVEAVLEIIQNFEPAGVAARSLKECLLIQLKQHGETDDNAFYIVRNRLDDLGENKLSLIAKDLNISIHEVQEIADKIKKLDPKPGRIFDADMITKYVIPDVFVVEDGGNYIVSPNDRVLPKLGVSPLYNELKGEENENPDLKKYLSERFNSAMWLIKSIEQRSNTIQKVAEYILSFQNAFFREGIKALKPLTLKQVGEAVGVHESTVSRAINEKYLQCDKGVFELKYFFSGGLKTESGDDFSSNSVKVMIKEIIEKEDERHPLSDLKIAEILAKDGLDISRRTVAKYRESMGIQSSSGRRRF